MFRVDKFNVPIPCNSHLKSRHVDSGRRVCWSAGARKDGCEARRWRPKTKKERGGSVWCWGKMCFFLARPCRPNDAQTSHDHNYHVTFHKQFCVEVVKLPMDLISADHTAEVCSSTALWFSRLGGQWGQEMPNTCYD